MNLLFSDQSYLNLITKLLDTNKTFISEIINPSIDLFLNDFDESQKKLIKKTTTTATNNIKSAKSNYS